jgi:hypothetical protein
MNSKRHLFGDRPAFLSYLLGNPKNAWFLSLVQKWQRFVFPLVWNAKVTGC